MGLAAALAVIAGGWVALDTSALGIPDAVGPIIAALAGIVALAANAFRAFTDPQGGG